MSATLKKLVKAAVISGSLVAATAQAQTVSVGHASVVSGAGAKAAHADQLNVSVDDSNLTVSGGVADGVRVGDTKIQTGLKGTVSVPVPTPSRPIPVPTPEQMAAPLVAPINIAKKVLGF
jgi:hypothetical protein